jgi:hypothetical protein
MGPMVPFTALETCACARFAMADIMPKILHRVKFRERRARDEAADGGPQQYQWLTA